MVMRFANNYNFAILLVFISIVTATIWGFSTPAPKPVETVSEFHRITAINGNEVHGELVKGTGEGIFYYKKDFIKDGIKDVKVGDIIKCTWSKADYTNENWQNVELRRVK